ncbi:hypothetical protein B0J15DRAFT_489421 [Fusarium solani]|uniref:Uncharacterized protein n=1 Tax=Fusarium solani TaxID=169388 RepID=A0A9P9HUP0_FUSSL|nr:uncharacterized protein B0J15DRAFT_489421 [Fusarium solani]KAH7263915.1 hypothetical protein B0J15DRAFT_489421 [Fusarium solani]
MWHRETIMCGIWFFYNPAFLLTRYLIGATCRLAFLIPPFFMTGLVFDFGLIFVVVFAFQKYEAVEFGSFSNSWVASLICRRRHESSYTHVDRSMMMNGFKQMILGEWNTIQCWGPGPRLWCIAAPRWFQVRASAQR